MTEVRLTEAAATDLRDIFEYSLDMFGIARADAYRADLVNCFSRLANNPLMGRSAEHFAKDVRRFEHARHVLFYKLDKDNIMIVAIIHAKSVRSLEGN